MSGPGLVCGCASEDCAVNGCMRARQLARQQIPDALTANGLGASGGAFGAAKGWECPKCGSVYAPFVMECQRCNRRSPTQTGVGVVGDATPACLAVPVPIGTTPTDNGPCLLPAGHEGLHRNSAMRRWAAMETG